MNILSLCDQALVAWLISKGAGTDTDTWPAKNSEVKTLPETICFCHTFEEVTPYSNNYDVQAFVEVRVDGVMGEFDSNTDPRQKADERVKSVFRCFVTASGDSSGEKLGEEITEAAGLSDFTILNCRIIGGNQGFNPKTQRDRGNAWIDVIHLELTVCPADVL